jgi:hypothetical protein
MSRWDDVDVSIALGRVTAIEHGLARAVAAARDHLAQLERQHAALLATIEELEAAAEGSGEEAAE